MAAGPETTSTYVDLMFEMKGRLVENFPKYSVLLDQLKRKAPAREDFDGTSVRTTIIRNVKQGTGPVTESGTLNVARNIRTTKVNIPIATITHAINITKRLKKTSDQPDTSFASAMSLEMKLAEEAMPRTVNEFLNGDGTGLLATTTDSVASATHTVSGANAYQLYPGRVVDVNLKSSGANATNGAGREIVSYTETTATTGTVVFDSACTTTGSGLEGIYIEGSGINAGGTTGILQGVQQAAATTGTFEGINKAGAGNADWQGVDGRNGDTGAADLSISILDGCIRRRGRNGTPNSSLWVSDEAVLDKFSQSLLTQSRWAGDKGTLDTGFEYVNYRGERIFPEYDAKRSRIVHVPVEDVSFYATQPGPDWDDEDGNIFRRVSRSLPVEAWLVDELQLGVHRCNRFVFADNLNQAS